MDLSPEAAQVLSEALQNGDAIAVSYGPVRHIYWLGAALGLIAGWYLAAWYFRQHSKGGELLPFKPRASRPVAVETDKPVDGKSPDPAPLILG